VNYGIKAYTYNNFLIKTYTDDKLKIFRKLDMGGFKNIKNSTAKKSIHKYIPELINYSVCRTNKCYIAIYNNVSIPLKEYVRYLSKDKLHETFIKISKAVEKFHNKAIILGDLDPDSIYIYNEEIVFTSFYSNTEHCNYYGEKTDNLKSNIFSQNIITSSLDSLNMKACSKLSDLESCMWLYMYIINHELMQKIKESIYSSTDFSIQNIIKKKENFVKRVVRSNYLLQTCNGDVFNFTEEVLRFINFFN
jgi:serine/threonine protein kinase